MHKIESLVTALQEQTELAEKLRQQAETLEVERDQARAALEIAHARQLELESPPAAPQQHAPQEQQCKVRISTISGSVRGVFLEGYPYDIEQKTEKLVDAVAYGPVQQHAQAALSDEKLDEHINAVLRPSGTKIANYTIQKNRDDMRAAMRSIIALYSYQPVAAPATPVDGEPDHGDTVLRVQAALGCTDTGWIGPDVILLRIEQLKASIDPWRDVPAWATPAIQQEGAALDEQVQKVEVAAKAIYVLLPEYRGSCPKDYPWQDGGNSDMQEIARDMARAALASQASKGAGVVEDDRREMIDALIDGVDGCFRTALDSAYAPGSDAAKAARKRFYEATDALKKTAAIALSAPSPAQAQPVTHNPHTGKPRDPRDIVSDPQAILCVAPNEQIKAAQAQPVADAAQGDASEEQILDLAGWIGYEQGRDAGIEEAAKAITDLVNPRHEADDQLMHDGWWSGHADALLSVRALAAKPAE